MRNRQFVSTPFVGFPKRCMCGRTWDLTAWHRLDYVGIMDDGVDRIELRQCVCDSTISVHEAAATTQAP